MPFTQQTIDFLFENRLHDSREWFNAHKQDYKTFVIEPFTEFINEIAPTMMKVDKLIICDPKRISRIYRDARYSPDSIFRDHLWYTFARERANAYEGHPGYYFSIGAGGISYGCGYYCANSGVKEAVRTMILSDDDAFKSAYLAYKGQKTFTQYGELYKKNHFPSESPEKCDWLNRKEYGVCFDSSDPAVMFSEGLARKVAKDFKKIAPLYDFYMKAQALSTIKG